MPNRVVTLKIDFKIVDGKLVIIDLGDGLSAGLDGFEKLNGVIFKNHYEATGATAVATLFGELPKDLMAPEALHIPLIRRTQGGMSYINVDDVSSSPNYILPFSGCERASSAQAYVWRRLGVENIAEIPISLMAVETHKALWYMLADKLLSSEERQRVVYWKNDSSPKSVSFSGVDMQAGVFIKIIDRSNGGGGEVFYAKNEEEARQVLVNLHQTYCRSTEEYKKHLYVIEPAYITLKKEYNVTGRAFFTLSIDAQTQAMSVKVAGAQWIVPKEKLKPVKSQMQMLANAEHSIAMWPLTEEELAIVSRDVVERYGELFRVGFEHDNLMEYCSDHPLNMQFLECLRPNATYKLCLSELSEGARFINKKRLLEAQVISLIQRDYVPLILRLLDLDVVDTNGMFKPAVLSLTEEKILNNICNLSLMEQYIQFIKSLDSPLKSYLDHLVVKERRVEVVLNVLLVQYLKVRNSKYDRVDFSRALRQACHVCDLSVIKLLVYTNRADVNAYTETSCKTPLDFLEESAATESKKEHPRAILMSVGAERYQSLHPAVTDEAVIQTWG